MAMRADRVDERHRRGDRTQQLVVDGAGCDRRQGRLDGGLGGRRSRLRFRFGSRRLRFRGRGRRGRARQDGNASTIALVLGTPLDDPGEAGKGSENGVVPAFEELAPRGVDGPILEVLLEERATHRRSDPIAAKARPRLLCSSGGALFLGGACRRGGCPSRSRPAS
jgi:hypothetical protein